MDESCLNKKPGLSKAVSALKHRNFRLFWIGQCVSLTGTWMQNMAQAWLVLELTRSAFWLGIVSTVQFMPMLTLSLYAGTVIDRFPKKKMLLLAQGMMMVLAFVLALDTWLGTVNLWHILIMAGLLGIANTFDMPTRQAFVIELVGRDDLMNAIVLNSSIFNGARVVGPSLAGFLIDQLGIDWCFLLNALSFLPVIGGLVLIKLKEVTPAPEPSGPNNAWHEIKAGLNYVKSTDNVLIPMLILSVISIFALNFNVLIPLYAKNVFHGGADKLGFLMAANGIGALAGSALLAVRSSGGPKFRTLLAASLGLCVFELLLVPVNSYAAAYVLLGLVGICLITFTTAANSLVQVQTPHHLRGRVMSIFTLIFAGFTPIGSFFTGVVAHAWGAPATMGIFALTSFILITALGIRFREKFSL